MNNKSVINIFLDMFSEDVLIKKIICRLNSLDSKKVILKHIPDTEVRIENFAYTSSFIIFIEDLQYLSIIRKLVQKLNFKNIEPIILLGNQLSEEDTNVTYAIFAEENYVTDLWGGEYKFLIIEKEELNNINNYIIEKLSGENYER